VNLAANKTLAFAISGVYAGVAGSLYVILRAIVTPGSFIFLLSMTLLIGAVVGGLGSLPGMVLGALFIKYLPTVSTHISDRPGAPDFIFGAAIILIMILLPSGAGGLIKRAFKPLTTWLYTRP
jgi:branched-chain amino acid transport system permease protein